VLIRWASSGEAKAQSSKALIAALRSAGGGNGLACSMSDPGIKGF
jgi:hypothetical protein